jgi:hypothetical protein
MDLLFMLVFLAFIICGTVVVAGDKARTSPTAVCNRMTHGFTQPAQALGAWSAGPGRAHSRVRGRSLDMDMVVSR